MDDAGAEGRAAGLKPSVMHLGLVRARLELAGIELAEERERVIALLVLAVAGAVLATFAVAAVSLVVVAYFWDTHRYQAIAAIGAVYGVLAALAFARASSIVRRAPSPFSATIAEFEKDRSAFSGERPPAP
jgi:uncharacterized membrane protein YqjE